MEAQRTTEFPEVTEANRLWDPRLESWAFWLQVSNVSTK